MPTFTSSDTTPAVVGENTNGIGVLGHSSSSAGIVGGCCHHGRIVHQPAQAQPRGQDNLVGDSDAFDGVGVEGLADIVERINRSLAEIARKIDAEPRIELKYRSAPIAIGGACKRLPLPIGDTDRRNRSG